MEKYKIISLSSCLICAETELCKVHQLPKYSRPYNSQFKENIKTFCKFIALPTPEVEKAYENGFAISPLCHVCQERIKLVSSLYSENPELNSNQLDTLRNSIVADLDKEYYFDDDEAPPAPTLKAVVPLENIRNGSQDNEKNAKIKTVLETDVDVSSDFYRESGSLFSSPAHFRHQIRQKLKVKPPIENTLRSITATDTSVSAASVSPSPAAIAELPEINDTNVNENDSQITDAVDSIANAWVDQSDFTFQEIEVIDYVEAIVVANPDAERTSQDKNNDDAEFIANLLFGNATNSDSSPPPNSSQHPNPSKSVGSDVENPRELSDTDTESESDVTDADSDEQVLTSDSEKYETDPLKICKKIKNATPSTKIRKRKPNPKLDPATCVECPYKGRPESRATCARLFRDQRRLDAHIQRMHLHEKYHQSYKCQYCPIGVTSLKKLEDHEKLHTGTKDSLCSTCGEAFRTEAFLLSHQRKVHGEPYPFVCETCSKGFNFKCHLRTHQLSHAGEFKFRCEKCNAGFHHKSAFNTHKLIHTQERNFQCRLCFATFRSKGTLSFHMKKHGEKSWMCDICGKGFWSQFILKNHKETHRTDKPFGCDKCDYKTKTNLNLRFHIKYTHEGLRYNKKAKDPHAEDSSYRGNQKSARRPRSTRKTKVPAKLRQFE